MAGSRREALGTILKRIQGLLRSGAMKEEDRPIWYDVVKAIPPKPLPPPRPVQKILYPEDFVRVQFHQTYGNNDALSLTDPAVSSASERFVDMYMDLHQQGNTPSHMLFEKTALGLKDQGINLKSHDADQEPKLIAEKDDSMLDIDKLFSEKT